MVFLMDGLVTYIPFVAVSYVTDVWDKYYHPLLQNVCGHIIYFQQVIIQQQ